MVNKLTKKSILKAKELIDSYGKEMAKLQEKIDAIDEKYRKMAEEARKDLANEYANLEAEQEIWQSSLSRFDENDVNEVLGEYESNSTSDEEQGNSPVEETVSAPEEEPVVGASTTEESIVDTIFPENNDEEVKEESTVEESISSEAEALAELWPEQTQSTTEEEKESETETESVSEADFTDGDNNTQEAMTEEVEKAADEASEWPDFPQEW